MPPFFLPLYASSLGFSSSAGAGFVAAFNFSSAVGRLMCGVGSDAIGPVNTLLISLLMSAVSMLVIWPVSKSLGPLIAFVIINGAANGGFFATMPMVVGNTFGSLRVSVAMGMMVTGWAGGYLLVSTPSPAGAVCRRLKKNLQLNKANPLGSTNCGLSPRLFWREA